MPTVITDTASLAALCDALAHDVFVAVDTEFMREKTYYPQLCLIQIAGENVAAAIDPLAPGLDLAPLFTLMLNPAVMKVFHACRQDIEIFYHGMKAMPAPLFDTQVAAMVCGFGESVGYEALVNKLLGLAVDKSSRFTDWAKRPLSEKQLLYAMDDVLHLREIYKKMVAQLEKSGRLEWIREEMEPISDPAIYDTNPDDVWRKIRLRHTSARYLARLQAAARWRELLARARNVPRGRIMKDETLAEIAHAKPDDFAGLQAIRGFYPTMQAGQYDGLFAELKLAEALPAAQCPRMEARPQMPQGSEAIADLLRLLLRAQANEHQVVARLIADKDEIEALAAGKRDHIHALTGWRGEVFGQHALRLLSGNVALKADGENGIVFVDLP